MKYSFKLKGNQLRVKPENLTFKNMLWQLEFCAHSEPKTAKIITQQLKVLFDEP